MRGKLREPGIDVANEKLVRRHLATIFFTRFGEKKGVSVERMRIDDFLEKMLPDFRSALAGFSLDREEKRALIPLT